MLTDRGNKRQAKNNSTPASRSVDIEDTPDLRP
jgi:hypothetical protein